MTFLDKNGAYVGAVLSDIHDGAIEAKQWYSELDEGFLKYINKLPILDFVILSGDFFHMKISANSDYAKYALMFLSKLLEICIEKNTKLRIIKGTESHDNRQLEMFDGIVETTECDFKIFYTVSSEYLFDDLRVLYIPEEYMPNKQEYYEKYFTDGKYDYIIGHGLVDKAVFIASLQESEGTRPNAPIFKVDELMAISNGPVYFGHIHKPMKVDRFRYVGSYSRWSFGEEEDKGFIMSYFNPSTKDYVDEFIINKNARRFDTLKVEYSSSLFKKPPQEQLQRLLELTDSLVVDYLRLEVNIPEDYPNPLLLTNLINEAFSNRKEVKLKINNNSKLRQKKETEDKINLLLDKFSFIFDKDIEPEVKISKFIKIHYGRDISLNKMRQYLADEIITRRGNV